jgi:5-methylcytosine-specific restriction protein B
MTHPLVTQVVAALATDKNVLLYGPPGTGKTWLVSEVIAYLQSRASSGGRPTLRTGATDQQFGTAAGPQIGEIPTNIHIEWITFHQSYSYEEFIVGRRPKPEGSGIVLEPHFGLLMTIAIQIQQSGGPDACLLIIDELNRANTGQVFGEFITLLDPEYRSTMNGAANSRALHVRLPGIAYEGGLSEPIRMLRGGNTYKLPEDWTFPEHVYVLATMNSVDKAALPLDSALTRRFQRIEMKPSADALASRFSVSLDALQAKAAQIRRDEQPRSSLTPEETAILLLDRVNAHIRADMGEDFEIGHALLWNVGTAEPGERWQALARTWDRGLLPQIQERYAGRRDALAELLKATPGSPTEAAFRERYLIGAEAPFAGAMELVPLLDLRNDDAIAVLQNLAL